MIVRARIVVATVVASAGAGCGGDADLAVGDDSCVYQTVDSAGATMVHRTGARLVIPPLALSQKTMMQWCGAYGFSKFEQSEFFGALPFGQSYGFGTNDTVSLELAVPAEIDLPLPEDHLSELEVAHAQIYQSRIQDHMFTPLVTVTGDEHMLRTWTAVAALFSFAHSPVPQSLAPAPTSFDLQVGDMVDVSYVGQGGIAPYQFSILDGTLPLGLTLEANGQLHGQVEAPGLNAVLMDLVDGDGNPLLQPLAFDIVPPAVLVPQIYQLQPAQATAGAGDTTIIVDGNYFTADMQALFDGAPIDTYYFSATQLLATIPAAALTQPGAHAVSVAVAATGSSVPAAFTVVATP